MRTIGTEVNDGRLRRSLDHSSRSETGRRQPGCCTLLLHGFCQLWTGDPSLVSYRHGVDCRRSHRNLASCVTRSIGECRMSLWSTMVVSVAGRADPHVFLYALWRDRVPDAAVQAVQIVLHVRFYTPYGVTVFLTSRRSGGRTKRACFYTPYGVTVFLTARFCIATCRSLTTSFYTPYGVTVFLTRGV